jgi:hypothetical protein
MGEVHSLLIGNPLLVPERILQVPPFTELVW